MKLYRFMSLDEMLAYSLGLTLHNNTDWRLRGQASSSNGFCFFDDSVPPEERIPYVNGVVCMDVCVEFEMIGPVSVTLSEGRYRDKNYTINPVDLLFGEPKTVTIREYCMKSYSRDALRMVRFGRVNPARRKIVWRDA